MFDIKMKARYMVHSHRHRLIKSRLEQLLMLLCIAVCSAAAVCIFLSGENFIRRYFPFSEKLMLAVILSAALCFTYFYFSSRLYFHSLLFYISGESFSAPAGYMRVSAVIKYAVCLFVVRGEKLLWRGFLFSPCSVIGVLIFRTLEVRGGMPSVMLYTLCAAFAVLFAVGVYFYLLVCGRFVLCEMLFIRNPVQSIREIIKTSQRMYLGQRTGFVLFGIRKSFYLTVRGKCICALMLQELFGERRLYRRLYAKKAFYQSIPRAF